MEMHLKLKKIYWRTKEIDIGHQAHHKKIYIVEFVSLRLLMQN
jgi:hypothetical protein